MRTDDSSGVTDARPGGRCELAGVLAAAWLAFVAIPLAGGGIGLSWDALNHHVYLGWIADQSRFSQDFLAAGYQSFQFPYLYWPVYKLALAGVDGRIAGAVIATLHLILVPPIWMISRRCIPEAGAVGSLLRVMAVVLAFLSSVVLSVLDSTANDALAAAPLVWSVAFALELAGADTPSARRRIAILSGFLAGVAVACKLSNAPLAALLPLLWLFGGRAAAERLSNTFLACLAMLAGFVAIYGYWGWNLWSQFGNPVYPLYDVFFEGLRNWIGWSP